jgi:hypothetical protein
MEVVKLEVLNNKSKVIRKKDMFEKIKYFIELDDKIINNLGQLFRYSYIKCPCNRVRKLGVEQYCDKNGKLLDVKDFELYSVYRYINHLHSQIRLYGDDVHINILVDLIGIENSINLLNVWITKNINVTEKLKLAVIKLNNMLVPKKAEENKKEMGK